MVQTRDRTARNARLVRRDRRHAQFLVNTSFAALTSRPYFAIRAGISRKVHPLRQHAPGQADSSTPAPQSPHDAAEAAPVSLHDTSSSSSPWRSSFPAPPGSSTRSAGRGTSACSSVTTPSPRSSSSSSSSAPCRWARSPWAIVRRGSGGHYSGTPLLSGGVFRHGRHPAAGVYTLPFCRDGRTPTVGLRRSTSDHYPTLATNGRPDASMDPFWADSAIERSCCTGTRLAWPTH